MKKIDIILEVLKKFPDMSSAGLAKFIYKKYPLVWSNSESIRKTISKCRNDNKQVLSSKAKQEIFKKSLLAKNEKIELIKGIRSKRSPYILPKTQRKTLIISDLHIPYHADKELDVAINYGIKQKVDTIIINGDFMDFYEVSRFEKDPRECNLPKAIETGKAVIKYIRKKFPKALIIFKLGNHDRRLEDKLINKAPELLGLNFWKMEEILELNKLNIITVADLDYIMLGKLKIIHGHEIKGGFIAPVNPARGLFLKVKESCLQSHVHRTSEHSEKTLGGKIISTWSIGCLADLQPDYNPYNQYNHGFAIIEIEANGDFEVFNKKIINGKIV